MKKLIVIAVLTFSFLATARTTNKHDNPIPTCNPCPFVR